MRIPNDISCIIYCISEYFGTVNETYVDFIEFILKMGNPTVFVKFINCSISFDHNKWIIDLIKNSNNKRNESLLKYLINNELELNKSRLFGHSISLFHYIVIMVIWMLLDL